ncbi:MAG: tetratricopeptide repeat protein [Chitinophagales bacterium]|jgi:tetratricopeptide (TPR) repeat protein|nr:tetratricopeptide repeat protein [Chitinophagales bacterium]
MNRLLITCIVFLIGSISLSAQISKGLISFHSEQYPTALAEFEKLNNPEGKFYEALTHFRNRDEEKAMKMWQENGNTPFGMIGSGILELNQNKNTEAEALFQAALKQDKKNAQLYAAIARGITFSDAKNKSKAVEYATKAREMSASIENLLMLGDAELMNQEAGKALRVYGEILDKDPKNDLAQAKIGKAFFNARDFKRSDEELDKALAINPNSVYALIYKAQIAFRRQDYKNARAYQEKVIQFGDQGIEDKIGMANFLFLDKDYAATTDYVSKLVQENSQYNYLNRLIGYSYYEQKNYGEAENYLSKFIESQPKKKLLPKDYIFLGKAIANNSQDMQKAEQLIDKGFELAPDDEDNISDVADAYKDIKSYKKAADYLELKFEKSKSSKDLFNLGNIYFMNKDYTSAEERYTKLIETDPNMALAYYQRALSKVRIDPDQTSNPANLDYEKFIELSQGDERLKKMQVNSYVFLVKYYIKNNDKANAKTYYDQVVLLDGENAQVKELTKYF